MKNRESIILPALAAVGGLLLLIIFPAAASKGAIAGLTLCASVIVPSLFAFMVFGNLFSALDLPGKLGRFLFRGKNLGSLSGSAPSVFILGMLGGYPMGAASVSELYKRQSISKAEAKRLLFFCDNCGPAFIVSAAGTTIFGSREIGLFLWAIHVFSAVVLALFVAILSKREKENKDLPPVKKTFPTLGRAFTDSVKTAATTVVSVCGFVVFFNVVTGLMDESGMFPELTLRLSQSLGMELSFIRSLLTGLLEPGTGVGSMSGLIANSLNLSLCSFVLGWGGLSVQAQAAAIIGESGLSSREHFVGKMLHGFLSALVTSIAYPVFFG